MRNANKAVFAWLCCVLFSGLSAVSWGSVSSELTVHKVVKDKDGKEILVAAESAKPGEVLQYTTTYRNTGQSAVTSLTHTLPIPTAMAYLPNSDKPKADSASIDGKAFSPLPLMRKSPANPDKLEPIPPAEYRYIRWTAPKLDAKQSVRYSVRVQVLATVNVTQPVTAQGKPNGTSRREAADRRRP